MFNLHHVILGLFGLFLFFVASVPVLAALHLGGVHQAGHRCC